MINRPRNKQRFSKDGIFRLGIFIALLVLAAIAVLLFSPKPHQSVPVAKQESDYAILAQESFNQPQYYPPLQTVPSNLYRPIGNWVGRLILPTQQQTQTVGASASQLADWVWLEVYHAPAAAQSLVGKVVRLEWSLKPEAQADVRAVTRDVHQIGAATDIERQGNVLPDRLNGRVQVGPLQSLAGARPDNDVIVTLENASVAGMRNGLPVLQIEREPVLATGRFYGLVKILGPEATADKNSAPPLCPGNPPCPSEFFRVHHYNSVSGQFDGPSETIRIPQQTIGRDRLFPSTPRQIEDSRAGKAGWYVYGAKNAKGIFVVQAIAPRSLFQLQPDQVISGVEAGLTYIKYQNWQDTEARKGTVQKVLIDQKQQLSDWQEGDKAILLHNFGGIGGKKAEQQGMPGTVTGHFAYGLVQVIREPFTQELQFAIQYQQIYAHNPNGIISGKNTWENYMGNLQWGWLGTRPVSDVIVKFDAVTQDYNFDGVALSPLRELLQQLQLMMARYRVGDGRGFSTVTLASSCIQDSSQALYAALKRIKEQVASTPKIQSWLKAHPEHPQTLRFEQLVSLAAALKKELTPLGIVRADWDRNADNPENTSRNDSIWAGLTSWRTILPRLAHDELASIFLRHGAQLWFLRTNQVGGWDPDITPLAPTRLLGQVTIPFTGVPAISILINRLLSSLTLPSVQDWLIVTGTLLIYGAIALPLGFSSGFLRVRVSYINWISQILVIVRVLVASALSEELAFRVLLLPYPTQVFAWWKWELWAVLSLFLFTVYYHLKVKIFFRTEFSTFFDRVFLTLVGLLGLACTVVYALTGSLLAIAVMHSIVMATWLLELGGLEKLNRTPRFQEQDYEFRSTWR